MTGLRRTLLVLLAAAAAVAVAYAPARSLSFLKDDFSLGMLLDPEGRISWSQIRAELLWPTARTWDDIWRPIPALSWVLDYALHGTAVRGWNLTQFLLHAVNAALLGLLIARVLGLAGTAPAVVAALTFAVTPLGPEAVLWKTQRTVLLGLLFELGALHMAWSDLARPRGRRLGLLALLYALALLSREHAAALPGLLLLLALLRPGGGSLRARLAAGGRQVAATLPVFGAYLIGRLAIFGRISGGYSGWDSMAAYARDVGVIEGLPLTLRQLIWPANHWYLGRPLFEAGPPSIDLDLLYVALGLATIAVLGIAALREAPSRVARGLVLAFGFAIASWLPVALVLRIDRNLLHSRSGYHVAACLLPTLAALGTAALRRPWSLLLPLLLAGSFAAHLTAYLGGDRQIRTLQAAIVQVARPGSPVAVFGVPSEYPGCPTIDSYLPELLRPPFHPERLPAIPFVFGQEWRWAGTLREAEARHGPAPGWTLRVYDPRTMGLREALDAGEGPSGIPTLVAQAPPDGILAVAAGEPTRFEVLGGRPGRVARLRLRTGAHAHATESQRPDAEGRFGWSAAELRVDGATLPWPLPAEVFPVGAPLLVFWCAEELDGDGTPIARTAERRLLYLFGGG